MPHLDDDELALLALGERLPDHEKMAHADSCERCRFELLELNRVVTAGRANRDAADELSPPAPHVWAAIAAAVDAAEEPQDARTDAAPATSEVTQLRPRAERRTLPTWLAVAAGVVVGVSGAAVVQTLASGDQAAPQDRLVAAAELSELGANGTSGAAEIRDTGDARVLSIELTGPLTGSGFREVWLLDPKTGDLISLGVLNGRSSTFELPADLHLRDYPTVDVSREPLDGNPAHSADSIARGELEL